MAISSFKIKICDQKCVPKRTVFTNPVTDKIMGNPSLRVYSIATVANCYVCILYRGYLNQQKSHSSCLLNRNLVKLMQIQAVQQLTLVKHLV